MIQVLDFENGFAEAFPRTHEVLREGNLTVHPSVSMITLHGSRGPKGAYRPDSDIDLALVVDTKGASSKSDMGPLLRNVLELTLANWQGEVEADLAAIIDISGCGLECLEWSAFREERCQKHGAACPGLCLYKIQRGFDGFTEMPATELKLIYPCTVIWRNRSMYKQMEIS